MSHSHMSHVTQSHITQSYASVRAPSLGSATSFYSQFLYLVPILQPKPYTQWKLVVLPCEGHELNFLLNRAIHHAIRHFQL